MALLPARPDGALVIVRAPAPGGALILLLHHTDQSREFAYDRASPIGRMDKALDEAPQRGWIVVDMARDWSTVFGN